MSSRNPYHPASWATASRQVPSLPHS